MRFVEIEPGLRLRFPGQSAEFVNGVEAGVVATLLALGQDTCSAEIAVSNLEQIRSLAESFGYSVTRGGVFGNSVEVTFLKKSRRPALKIVR